MAKLSRRTGGARNAPEAVLPEGQPIHSIGRPPNVWSWPERTYAHPDRTFGNRWDDPQGHYRVLYACRQRAGTLIETLARFRPDPKVVAACCSEIAGEDAAPIGEVPRDWLANSQIGSARISGNLVEKTVHADGRMTRGATSMPRKPDDPKKAGRQQGQRPTSATSRANRTNGRTP